MRQHTTRTSAAMRDRACGSRGILRRWTVSRLLGGAAALLLLSGAASAQTLQLYYPLEDGVAPGGLILNLAGTGDGTLVGGGTWVASTAPSFSGGTALRFTNDENQFIDTALSAGTLGFTNGNPNGYAATAWVNMTACCGDSMVFGQNSTPALHDGVRDGAYHMGHWGNDITVGTVTFDGANGPGNWHHVIWEYAQGVERIYVDGNNIGSAPRGTLSNNANVQVGTSENNGGFNGLLDDVAVYSLSGGQRLFPNQVAHLASGGNPIELPAADPESLPSAPDFIPVGLGGGGAGFATMHVIYTDGLLADLHSVTDASNALQSGVSPLVAENVPMVNHADTGPGGSPGGGYSVLHPKLRYPGDVDGDTEDFAYVYNGYVNIPADGMYTFGIDGDDGQRLKVAGAQFEVIAGSGGGGIRDFKPSASDVFSVEGDTGDAFTLAKTFLTAGAHQFQVIGYERGGGAFNEAFAAVGVTTDISNFQAIGGAASPPIVAPPTLVAPFASGQAGSDVPGWDVVRKNGPNNINAAIAAIEAIFADPLGQPNDGYEVRETISYSDDVDGGGNIGFPQVVFPGDVPGVGENDFAIGAATLLTVNQSGLYRFTVFGDDGSQFRLQGSSGWTAGGIAAVDAIGDGIFIGGCCADGFGEVFLNAGEQYIAQLIWNEIGGGAYVSVRYSIDGQGNFLLGSSADGSRPAGLELVPEPSSFVLAGFGLAGLFVGLRRRRK